VFVGEVCVVGMGGEGDGGGGRSSPPGLTIPSLSFLLLVFISKCLSKKLLQVRKKWTAVYL